MAQAVRFADLVQGIVVETRVESLTGGWFYSDTRHNVFESYDQPFLNEFARVPLLGRIAGVIRMVLSTLHSIGHLLLAVFTFEKGHLYHAAKGGCEFLRGFIEAIPFLGGEFADYYCMHGEWWIIKIYHPEKPDTLDEFMGNWEYFKNARPTGYIKA